MDIIIGNLAKETLKRKKIPDNCSGIFLENNEYCWWVSYGRDFDSGETKTFDESFNIIRNLTSSKN
jgi:hypothetical protein